MIKYNVGILQVFKLPLGFIWFISVVDIHRNSIIDQTENVVTENKDDGSGDDSEIWINNLQLFFEDNFFPAFELQKDISRVQNAKKPN